MKEIKKINNKTNLKTMKKILFFAAALTAMAGCTSNEFVGDPTDAPTAKEGGAISFGSGFYHY